MPCDIAVYVGESGETASLYEKGKVIVYRRKCGVWNVQREQHFSLDKSMGLKELRNKMAEVLNFLKDCKIFVGLSMVGVPYFELEKSNFSVWEFEGKPLEFLDYILKKEKESQEQKVSRGNNQVQITPVETSNGCYKISLKEIQENKIGITSKQALLPFLRKGKFYSLQVLCNHIPPWLESELISGKHSWEIKTISNNEVLVTITQKCCH